MSDGVDPARIIPRTALLQRYRRLRQASESQRLVEAGAMLADLTDFANEFAASVERFAAYDNAAEHFYDDRPERRAGPGLVRTPDVGARLAKQRLLEPSDADHRLSAADAAIADVAATALAVEYVDHELLIHRTTSPSRWDDGARNVGGLRLDLLLANAHDRVPAVAELKTPNDMDPFFALIQVLACAAHLATPSQYERLSRHLPNGAFPPVEGGPRLDVYVLTVKPELESQHRYQGELRRIADELAPRLLGLDAITRCIRRIVELELHLDGDGQVQAEVRAGYERR